MPVRTRADPPYPVERRFGAKPVAFEEAFPRPAAPNNSFVSSSNAADVRATLVVTALTGLEVRDIVAARKCVMYSDKIALLQVPHFPETIRANGIQQG